MARTESDAIRIQPLSSLDAFDACVALQRVVWGSADADLFPRRLFVFADRIGGQVLGAFADGCAPLIGYTLALPGCRDGQSYWYSAMLAVAPEFRNRGIGRRLKIEQRSQALARGLERIEWTFDPLEIKNAHLNLARLGAITRRYCPNLYGESAIPLHAGLPTDRLIAEWWLHAPAQRPQPIERVEVPGEIQAWKAAGDPRAAQTQARIRTQLEAAFAAGFAAVGYERNGANGAYLLALSPL